MEGTGIGRVILPIAKFDGPKPLKTVLLQVLSWHVRRADTPISTSCRLSVGPDTREGDGTCGLAAISIYYVQSR
jgi:hypothetical protein